LIRKADRIKPKPVSPQRRPKFQGRKYSPLNIQHAALIIEPIQRSRKETQKAQSVFNHETHPIREWAGLKPDSTTKAQGREGF
jgi:hypothetical protein